MRSGYKKIDRDDDTEQRIYSFPNGYEASVIRGRLTYDGPQGLWEVAVLRNGNLDYSTPVTHGVIGHCSETEVDEILAQIEALPVPEAPKAPETPL